MKLTTPERQLYLAVMAQVIGQIVNKGRAKPAATAHRAAEFAAAAVAEFRIQVSTKTR